MKLAKKIMAFIAVMLLVNVATAQIKDVNSAYEEMKKKVSPIICIEKNELEIDTSQYCFNSPDSVEVGLFIKKGDYAKYWNKPNPIDTSRYYWVFIVEEFKERGKAKKIDKIDCTKNDSLSKRLCQLLGISDTVIRDSIISFKVSPKNLFRPAYNTSITNKTNESDKGIIKTTDNRIFNWFKDQQANNKYPWTRLGYTYDWGTNDTNHIGVSEFILKLNNGDTITRKKMTSICDIYKEQTAAPNSK